MTTEGTVKVTRDYWWEIWLDPNGREVKGEELRLLRAEAGRVSGAGDKRTEALAAQVSRLPAATSSHADGEDRQRGQGPIEFHSGQGWLLSRCLAEQSKHVERDRDRQARSASAAHQGGNVLSSSPQTLRPNLVIVHGGLEIIVDKDTVRAGQTAPVMLFVPDSDRYVLFSVEAEDLFSYQLVHVTGTAKLIELPIKEKHVPNIYLSAAMVSDAQLFIDTKQVVVPPVQHFLSVDVKSDREQYQPREEGTLSITAKDANGKPVSAEIALGLIDESVKYIQQDYAGDPRQFYFGSKRGHSGPNAEHLQPEVLYAAGRGRKSAIDRLPPSRTKRGGRVQSRRKRLQPSERYAWPRRQRRREGGRCCNDRWRG